MAKLLFRERTVLGSNAGTFVEMRAFEVPQSREFPDGVKYSLVFILGGECVLRYDNEHGKGHHRHFKGKEAGIDFKAIEDLAKDFLSEVEKIMAEKQKGVFE